VHNTFAQSDSLKHIKLELLDNNAVQDVHYQSLIVTNLEKNTKKVGWIILIISVLLLIIAVALINNTVRLALNDNRFIIKNMQYVGATENFIIKPYVRKAMINGFLSSMLAITAILGILYFLNQQVEILFIELFSLDLLIVFVGIILIGLIISSVSTFIAVRRFLRKAAVELY
jgi:cell division transport system permease protein